MASAMTGRGEAAMGGISKLPAAFADA